MAWNWVNYIIYIAAPRGQGRGRLVVCGVEVVGGGFYLAGQYYLLPCVWYQEIHRHIQVDDYNHVEYIYALVGFPRNFKEIFHSFVHGEFVFSRGAAAVLCARPLNSIKFRRARAWTPLSRYSGRVGVETPWDRTESHTLGGERWLKWGQYFSGLQGRYSIGVG